MNAFYLASDRLELESGLDRIVVVLHLLIFFQLLIRQFMQTLEIEIHAYSFGRHQFDVMGITLHITTKFAGEYGSDLLCRSGVRVQLLKIYILVGKLVLCLMMLAPRHDREFEFLNQLNANINKHKLNTWYFHCPRAMISEARRNMKYGGVLSVNRYFSSS